MLPHDSALVMVAEMQLDGLLFQGCCCFVMEKQADSSCAGWMVSLQLVFSYQIGSASKALLSRAYVLEKTHGAGKQHYNIW
ncbi:chromodomain-helicase-DNA-binding protein 5 [Platysternon megacephalum]|uniref:Chromodomain-helicase-DNA-binding protein 5 n=1 Tax=Platysternon megacephalum TaxID=55544 RepID=A0A4D9ET95_9SAUR|nr:chromodomain-helicase-DNA-binding protein 5 [Platysternon megacephalum]